MSNNDLSRIKNPSDDTKRGVFGDKERRRGKMSYIRIETDNPK